MPCLSTGATLVAVPGPLPPNDGCVGSSLPWLRGGCTNP